MHCSLQETALQEELCRKSSSAGTSSAHMVLLPSNYTTAAKTLVKDEQGNET
jgi:hypothetical protein